MGRKPNPVILQFFERGPRLTDNSNRYPHRCKSCGESFPKGRVEALITHLSKKCPAISEADRINACLALNGISGAGHRAAKAHVKPNGPPVDLPMMQRDWTALETLAEVSRQIDLSEKHDGTSTGAGAGAGTGTGTGAPVNGVSSTPHQPPQHTQERFELQEQFTLDNPPNSYKSPPLQGEKTAGIPQAQPQPPPQPSPEQPGAGPESDPTDEERLKTLEAANLSMAAAATARLNPSLLDPQLRVEDLPTSSPGAPADIAAPIADMSVVTTEQHMAIPVPAVASAQPWGELTYLSENISAAPTAPMEHAPSPSAPNKGGFRLDSANGAKARHSRARFDSTRRKEVQEVRRVGACIRCRILRKTCSPGDPCDTCRKVLSPRIWRSGCVRTKFTEQLDLYSAGVQIVLAQHRVNSLKAGLNLANGGNSIEVTHFPESAVSFTLEVLQSLGTRRIDSSENQVVDVTSTTYPVGEVVIIDDGKEDVPTKVEDYMRSVLAEFVNREPSHFVRITLESAFRIVQESNDALLKKAMELWGLVEILDRERQWSIHVRPTPHDNEGRWIKAETDPEIYANLCLQLTAAAERKATAISRSLLTGMQRVLQDSKTKVDYSMYLTTLILLNCAEKSTWAFKAWEQDDLKPLWPLEKQPGNFTQQGYILAELLRMLLGIRKVLPRTMCRPEDGVLVTDEQDPRIQTYFQNLSLNFAEVQARQQPVFLPMDSRSFELLFCSILLLPAREDAAMPPASPASSATPSAGPHQLA